MKSCHKVKDCLTRAGNGINVIDLDPKKTSRITSNNQNWKSARSDNTKYHSSIDVDLEDVPFQPNKCDRIMASIILSSIVGGFLFCLIYGYVMFINDHNDAKINKRHFFKRQDY